MSEYGYDKHIDRAQMMHDFSRVSAENSNKHGKYPRKIPKSMKIVLCVIVLLLVLVILYNVLVHPLDRFHLRMDVYKNVKITMVIEGGFLRMQTVEIIVDENCAEIKKHDTYLVYEEGQTYIYKRENNREWEGTPIDKSDLEINFEESLFDSSNYERIEGELFRWQLKDGVDVGDLQEVTLEESFGRLMIKGTFYINQQPYRLTMSFSGFGLNKVTLPWE